MNKSFFKKLKNKVRQYFNLKKKKEFNHLGDQPLGLHVYEEVSRVGGSRRENALNLAGSKTE